jgi:CubicO group peptidase (beta-lactamase class C family)
MYAPGTRYAYSNFGYCLLGRIMEKISGMRYEEYVHQNVLRLCGVTAMSIGGKTSAARLREVTYFGPGEPYLLDPKRMDSHGGWIASPTDLVEFALRVDGLPNPPDILQTSTLAEMNTPTAANPNYAKGWCVNSANNKWHNGGMPGTSSILVKTASGMSWAATANSHPEGVDGPLDNLMWKMARCVSSWRA